MPGPCPGRSPTTCSMTSSTRRPNWTDCIPAASSEAGAFTFRPPLDWAACFPAASTRPFATAPCAFLSTDLDADTLRHLFDRYKGKPLPPEAAIDRKPRILEESQPAEVNGLEFQVIGPRRWLLPADAAGTAVPLSLKITNRTDKTVRISLFDTIRLHLKGAGGKNIPMEGARDATAIPTPLLLDGHRSTATDIKGTLAPDDKHPGLFRLSGTDKTGFVWWFDGLKPGRYLLSVTYENTEKMTRNLMSLLPRKGAAEDKTPFWHGWAITGEFPVEIAESKNREADVLKAELQQAQAELARQEAAFKAGLIGPREFQATKDKVEVLEAELTGDPLQVARAKLLAARRQLELASRQIKAGLLTTSDYEKAKGNVAIAEAQLAEIMRRLTAESEEAKPPEQAVPLQSVYSTSRQAGLQHVTRGEEPKAKFSKNSPAVMGFGWAKDFQQLCKGWLISPPAPGATLPLVRPAAPEAQLWVGIYIGSSGSLPPQWLLDSVTLSRDNVWKVVYRHTPPGPMTHDKSTYEAWIPLGQSAAKPGRHRLQLIIDEKLVFEQSWTVVPAAAKLDFRVAATRGDGKSGLSTVQVAEYRKDTPEKSRKAGRPFAWFELHAKGQTNLIDRDYMGRTYVLLSTSPQATMLDVGPWGLKQVAAMKDAGGWPTIGVELNDAAGRKMEALSKANLRRPLVILSNDVVASAPVLQSSITNSAQITGSFSDDEVKQLVGQLQASITAAKRASDNASPSSP